MHSMTSRVVLIVLAGVLFACAGESVDLTEPDLEEFSAAVAAAKGGKGGGKGTALYDVQFSGDIASDPFSAVLSTKNPLKSAALGTVTLRFVATSGDRAVCDANRPNLSPTVEGWSGYGGAGWTGPLGIQTKGKKGATTHVGFNEGTSPPSGFINLVVNHPDGTPDDVNTVTFTNARALVGATSTHPDGTSDADDRCVNFVITAMRQ